MNSKKIIVLKLVVSMLIPSVAFAKNNSDHGKSNVNTSVQSQNSTINESDSQSSSKNTGAKQATQNNGQANKQTNTEKKDTKKQEIATFKSQIRAKHETMTNLRKQIIAEKQAIDTKSTQLNAIITDIESGKKTLPTDDLNTLLSEAQKLKDDSSAVKATSGVASEVNDAQSNINKKDFNNALASLDKVIAKLQARLAALKQLNSDLDTVLALANKATVPSTTSDTQNSTTTDASNATNSTSSNTEANSTSNTTN